MFKPNLKNKSSYRINSEIRASELRVIDEAGKQVGVLKTSDALIKAKELNTDLIEIAPNAKPPVAKLIQLGKFKYREEKKQREESKKAKGGELKEIRFSPFIAQNDYNTRLERIKEFLADKNKVRMVVVFKGSQLRSRSFGYDLIKKVLVDLNETAQLDSEPKFLGRNLGATFSPITKKGSKNAETENKKDTNKTT